MAVQMLQGRVQISRSPSCLRLGFGSILPAAEHVRSRPHALEDVDRCGLRDDVRLATVLDEVWDKTNAGQRCATPVKVQHAAFERLSGPILIEDEIAKAVDDQPPFVRFDGLYPMRM